jgi:hypothetical protein
MQEAVNYASYPRFHSHLLIPQSKILNPQTVLFRVEDAECSSRRGDGALAPL